MSYSREIIAEQVEDFVRIYLDKKFQFRAYQKDTIVDILYNVLNEGTPCHAIQAPTGSGKSIIAIISAGVLDKFYGMRSYILASDISLWEQYAKYIESHPRLDFGVLKGIHNYKCNETNDSITFAPCTLEGISPAMIASKHSSDVHGFKCADTCTYIKNRRKALRANVTLLTYQLYLHCVGNNATDPKLPVFDNRDVVFCDECHNLPSLMQLRYQFTFRREDVDALCNIYRYAVNDNSNLFDSNPLIETLCKKYPDVTDIVNAFNKCYDALIDYRTDNEQNFQQIKNMWSLWTDFNDIKLHIEENMRRKRKEHIPLDKLDKQIIVDCNLHQRYVSSSSIETFISIIDTVGVQYLVKSIIEIGTDKICQVQCAKEDYMVYRGIMCNTPKQVLLSATLVEKDDYEEQIGVQYSDVKEIKMDYIPSTFDFTNSPIYFLNKYKMSMAERDESLRHLKPILYKLLNDKLKNYKGIIQTGSYAIAKEIIRDAPISIKSRLLYYNGNSEKNEVIIQHQMSYNTILIGPTLNEGLDLPGDDCRFIFILKMPYPSIKDRLTVAKLDLFPKWYESTTAQKVIQGIGRGNRFKDDWCVTYIFDACFYKLYTNTSKIFPDEIRQRIKLLNSLN